MASIPFDPPKLLTVRRSSGFVDIPEDKEPIKEEWYGRRSFTRGKGSSSSEPFASAGDRKTFAGPTHLQREKTMAGNIVIFDLDGEPPQAFWLQRKIGKLSHGVIRLGYRLRRNRKPDFKESNEAWELDLDETGDAFLVKFLIMHSSVLDMKSDNQEAVRSPLDNLSALQMVAQNKSPDEAHVVGALLLGACSSHLYAVIPYYPDGTLWQYCISKGNVEEPIARFFFRQILQVSFDSSRRSLDVDYRY